MAHGATGFWHLLLSDVASGIVTSCVGFTEIWNSIRKSARSACTCDFKGSFRGTRHTHTPDLYACLIQWLPHRSCIVKRIRANCAAIMKQLRMLSRIYFLARGQVRQCSENGRPADDNPEQIYHHECKKSLGIPCHDFCRDPYKKP